MDKVRIKRKLKGSLKSKQNWIIAFPLTLFGAVQMSLPLLKDSISAEVLGVGAFVVGVAVYILRWFTDKPLESKVD